MGRDGEARSWDKYDVPASAKSYLIHVLRPTTEKTSSLRNVREMHTLAVILDPGRRLQQTLRRSV